MNELKIKPILVTSIGLSLFVVLLFFGIIPTSTTFYESDNLSANSILDNSVLQGHFVFTLRDIDNNLISVSESKNLVVNEGMECVSDLIFGTTLCTVESIFQYLAVGTGTSSTSDGTLSLVTESATCSRINDPTPTINTSISGQRTISISSSFSGAGCETESFGEVGLFDSSTSGNMLARSLITPAPILVGAGNSLTIDYIITIKNS